MLYTVSCLLSTIYEKVLEETREQLDAMERRLRGQADAAERRAQEQLEMMERLNTVYDIPQTTYCLLPASR